MQTSHSSSRQERSRSHQNLPATVPGRDGEEQHSDSARTKCLGSIHLLERSRKSTRLMPQRNLCNNVVGLQCQAWGSGVEPTKAARKSLRLDDISNHSVLPPAASTYNLQAVYNANAYGIAPLPATKRTRPNHTYSPMLTATKPCAPCKQGHTCQAPTSQAAGPMKQCSLLPRSHPGC